MQQERGRQRIPHELLPPKGSNALPNQQLGKPRKISHHHRHRWEEASEEQPRQGPRATSPGPNNCGGGGVTPESPETSEPGGKPDQSNGYTPHAQPTLTTKKEYLGSSRWGATNLGKKTAPSLQAQRERAEKRRATKRQRVGGPPHPNQGVYPTATEKSNLDSWGGPNGH